MKKRIIIYLFLFSFLTSIESAFTKNKIKQNKNLGYLKVKYDKSLNEYSSFKNSNYDTSILKEERFIIPAKINYFLELQTNPMPIKYATYKKMFFVRGVLPSGAKSPIF